MAAGLTGVTTAEGWSLSNSSTLQAAASPHRRFSEHLSRDNGLFMSADCLSISCLPAPLAAAAGPSPAEWASGFRSRDPWQFFWRGFPGSKSKAEHCRALSTDASHLIKGMGTMDDSQMRICLESTNILEGFYAPRRLCRPASKAGTAFCQPLFAEARISNAFKVSDPRQSHAK